MIHSEAAPGQYEIVASKHGLHATFVPRPFMTSAGSVAHAHISVHSTNEQKPQDQMSKHESAFLAGVIGHLPALPAITLLTPAFYKRMVDSVWSGGMYVHYGTENREAPIRLSNATSPSSQNFEMRFVDGTADPHLALAPIIGAGVRGLKGMKTLTVKDCPGPKCAWEMTEDERKALGITRRMPLDVEEARKYLAEDSGMKEVLGEVLVEKYLSVSKTIEGALLQDQDPNAQLTRLVEFY
ncbi:Protein fluG [Leucoagaricus sp. SymC.cos]|nr:Protein fluG [Leucoagaricus sp. SymC.cos]